MDTPEGLEVHRVGGLQWTSTPVVEEPSLMTDSVAPLVGLIEVGVRRSLVLC